MNDVVVGREILERDGEVGSEERFFSGVIGTPNCDACPLRYKVEHGKHVSPCGPIPADIAIVGEGPGYNEERRGEGFVGKSGQVLFNHAFRLAALRYGQPFIPRRMIWITNAALCRPERVKLSSGVVLDLAEVKRLSVECCRPRLQAELKRVRPKVIVPVGALALASILGLESASIYSYRGSRMVVDLDEMRRIA